MFGTRFLQLLTYGHGKRGRFEKRRGKKLLVHPASEMQSELVHDKYLDQLPCGAGVFPDSNPARVRQCLSRGWGEIWRETKRCEGPHKSGSSNASKIYLKTWLSGRKVGFRKVYQETIAKPQAR